MLKVRWVLHPAHPRIPPTPPPRRGLPRLPPCLAARGLLFSLTPIPKELQQARKIKSARGMPANRTNLALAMLVFGSSAALAPLGALDPVLCALTFR